MDETGEGIARLWGRDQPNVPQPARRVKVVRSRLAQIIAQSVKMICGLFRAATVGCPSI